MTRTHDDALMLLAAEALLVWAIRPDLRRETLRDAAARVAQDATQPSWRVEVARELAASPGRGGAWLRYSEEPAARARRLAVLRAGARVAAQFLLEVSELESAPTLEGEDPP